MEYTEADLKECAEALNGRVYWLYIFPILALLAVWAIVADDSDNALYGLLAGGACASFLYYLTHLIVLRCRIAALLALRLVKMDIAKRKQEWASEVIE